MAETTPPLTPMSLELLLGRISHEWATRKKIFDLPNARIWAPDPDIDLSFEFLGRKCASPVGPAAGPHSQLAQNIVLAWLGGSRLFELKTVQILDELEIPRPCIDMQTIGYNVEWSQELLLPQSLEEYTKAWMLLDMLREWEPLAEKLGPNPGAHVFDMSVGYDLNGIKTERVAAFIDGMRNASDVIERLRPQITGEFAQFADMEFSPVISDTLTLSTFHGCPPDEIEAIVKHLIDHHDLDVIVKLNPTLLGVDRVQSLVVDQLGYDYVQLDREAFEHDLGFDRGVELIGELNDYAKERGHKFGIKLTNTLVVKNHKQWMPDPTMYLSGAPLHVLASTLLADLADALPGQLMIPGHDGEIMVSYSAGINRDNLADTIATGVRPASVCSDLLKPGGYGRLAPMMKRLTAAVTASGATDLEGFREIRQAEAVAAGQPDTAHVHAAAIVSEDGIAPYHLSGNEKLPRAVDNELEMFECVACNFCVTVCPNDAFFTSPSLEEQSSRQQYLLLAELCNECGNCMTFCPEDGDPAKIKPRLFTDEALFNARDGQGFLIQADGTIVSRQGNDDSAAEKVADLLGADKGSPVGS